MSISTETNNEFLKLTDKAIEKLREFSTSMADAKGKNFRVYVQGGGCSGFSYGFMFDEARDDDIICEFSDVKCLVDPQSAMFLKETTVDFIESLSGAGFSVENPNATGTCGCGSSFSV